MFFNLASYSTTFIRPQKSKLILAVPLCARTIIFFCDDSNFYHYSLIDNKILYQSKLPGRIVQAIAISGHSILCTILETRSLMLLNIEEKSLELVGRLPQVKVHNENREKEIFTMTKLHVFQASNRFYIEQLMRDDNKTKIYYYRPQNVKTSLTNNESPLKITMQDFQIKEFNTRKMLMKKLDSESHLVLFKQQIQDNGTFKFSAINCQDFVTTQFQCENKVFTRFATVCEIRCITKSTHIQQSQMLIFVNSNSSQILLFSNNYCTQFAYKPKKVFLQTILINIRLGYGMFMFMPDPEDIPNQNYTEAIELINIQTGGVLEQRRCHVNEIVKSWEDDYLLMYRKETVPVLESSFMTENIICKEAFYMKIMVEKGFGDLSEDFMAEVIRCLSK